MAGKVNAWLSSKGVHDYGTSTRAGAQLWACSPGASSMRATSYDTYLLSSCTFSYEPLICFFFQRINVYIKQVTVTVFLTVRGGRRGSAGLIHFSCVTRPAVHPQTEEVTLLKRDSFY
ncbi:hypothetical protein BaRGS_00038010 [Batillaria attramentaria]|uniref:Uncharacterized protein n=1 Tax=Batillaria attramentaria TaxID=370345 RepID=A0ABD0J6Y3_9CAEN